MFFNREVFSLPQGVWGLGLTLEVDLTYRHVGVDVRFGRRVYSIAVGFVR